MAALMYQTAFLYNLIVRILHGNFRDYKIVADMVQGTSVLDLACATCVIRDLLPRNTEYEGWELNDSFISHCRRKGVTVKKKNIFDIGNEENTWNTIIVKDILHHVYPREKELLELSIGKADCLIVCEPILNGKRIKDVLFGHEVFDFMHGLIGDSDSLNDFSSGRLFQKHYTTDSFLSMLSDVGEIVEQRQNKEMVIAKLVPKKRNTTIPRHEVPERSGNPAVSPNLKCDGQ